MSKELVIISEIKEGSIHHNFDELGVQLDTMLEPYKETKEVTEDTYRGTKEVAANLQKFFDDIDGRRKAIKKAWMKPYDELETKIKALQNKVKDVIQDKRKVISDYESDIKTKKWDDIRQLIDETLEEKQFKGYKDFVVECPFLINPKWENAGFTMKKISDEIRERIEKIITDIEVISRQDTIFKNDLLTHYRGSGDISSCLLMKDRLEADSRASQRILEQPQRTETPSVEPEKIVMTIKLMGTKNQIRGVLDYCKTVGVKMQRIGG